ncbi:MAG TPA: hypothetical protein VGL38_07415 [bacterium]|jgi:hypothetical protein
MRFWILALLPVVLFLGCQDKATPVHGDPPEPPAHGHVPNAPDSVKASTYVGFGVVVRWSDNSLDETKFVLEHGRRSFTMQHDTLVANTAMYWDSLRLAEGDYAYRVRAGNDSGWSAWSETLFVSYRLKSDGLIPLREGNWWEFSADSGQTHYTYRHAVSAFRLIGLDDYYLLTASIADTLAADSIYYLRNCATGVTQLAFPSDSGAHADTLFRYPNIHSGDHYLYREDSIVVLNPPPGIAKIVGDTTFTGVISYQRFLNHDRSHSIRYYLVPQRVGLVREEEIRSGDIIAHHDIVTYHVEN